MKHSKAILRCITETRLQCLLTLGVFLVLAAMYPLVWNIAYWVFGLSQNLFDEPTGILYYPSGLVLLAMTLPMDIFLHGKVSNFLILCMNDLVWSGLLSIVFFVFWARERKGAETVGRETVGRETVSDTNGTS